MDSLDFLELNPWYPFLANPMFDFPQDWENNLEPTESVFSNFGVENILNPFLDIQQSFAESLAPPSPAMIQEESAVSFRSVLRSNRELSVGHSVMRGTEELRPGGKSKSPSKCNLDKSITTSSSISNKKDKIRKRKPFGPIRQKEVAQIRVIGACIPCKLKKRPCTFGVPCDRCFRRAGILSLGQELCTRQKLVDLRPSNVDLFRVATFGDLLNKIEVTVPHTARDLYIFWPTWRPETSRTIFKVQVQDFHPPQERLDTMKGDKQVIRDIGYSDFQERLELDSPYLLIPESMPSLDDLETCSGDSHHDFGTGPLRGLHVAFASFHDRYCNMSQELPLRQLLQKIVRAKRLIYVYTYSAIVSSEPQDTTNRYVSSWVKLQMRHFIGKEIMMLEAEILSELDGFVHNSQGISKQNPIAIWVCLWTLILTYRRHFSHLYWHYIHDKSTQDSLCGAMRHTYTMLLSIYATNFSTTSPIIFDWREENVYNMLGCDQELIEAFCLVKAEMFWLHADRHLLLPEDDLLRSLVLENENKLLESKKKEAKRKGLL